MPRFLSGVNLYPIKSLNKVINNNSNNSNNNINKTTLILRLAELVLNLYDDVIYDNIFSIATNTWAAYFWNKTFTITKQKDVEPYTLNGLRRIRVQNKANFPSLNNYVQYCKCWDFNQFFHFCFSHKYFINVILALKYLPRPWWL